MGGMDRAWGRHQASPWELQARVEQGPTQPLSRHCPHPILSTAPRRSHLPGEMFVLQHCHPVTTVEKARGPAAVSLAPLTPACLWAWASPSPGRQGPSQHPHPGIPFQLPGAQRALGKEQGIPWGDAGGWDSSAPGLLGSSLFKMLDLSYQGLFGPQLGLAVFVGDGSPRCKQRVPRLSSPHLPRSGEASLWPLVSPEP